MTSRWVTLIVTLSCAASCESTSSTTTAPAPDAVVDGAAPAVEETPDVAGAVEADLDARVGDPDDGVGTAPDTQLPEVDDTWESIDVSPGEDASAVDVEGEPDVTPEDDVATDQDTGPACTPDCEAKVCGPDGCGGDCGTCSEGELCTLGLCSSPGACTNDADGAVLASIDVAAAVEGCAKGCILESDKAACGGSCLAKEAGLSTDCAACFGGNVACAFTKCTFECGFGSAESCLDCQSKAGCFVTFESCAGLPPP